MARSPVWAALGAVCLVLATFWYGFALDGNTFLFDGGMGSAGRWGKLFGQHGWRDQEHGSEYLLGVGKADITGPVVEINFMGYADPAQTGTGLRQRLYSRAFIVGDLHEPADRFVYLVLDTQSGDTAVRHGILEALKDLGGEYDVYGNQNVAVTGTHSHSGPGAWLNYLLPQITSKGFHKPSYQAIVDGAVASIQRAHDGLAPGHLSVGTVEIPDANINRSPYAYLSNPAEERAAYEHDVDKDLTLLRFTHTSNSKSGHRDIGVLTWFPVHGTSMYGNNTHVTGDNKGVAAQLFEKSLASSNPSFVAGFSQANVGDTSPNVQGAYCEYGEFAGQQCDFQTSLCGNVSQPCHGRGPHPDLHDGGVASTYTIGQRQADAALRLFHSRKPSAFTPITGHAVRSTHSFHDLSHLTFPLANGSLATTCPAALGHSFAAGTTDGPGAFDFKQAQPGDPHANPLWSAIGHRLHNPNDTQKACHYPKPILLDVGETLRPYAWSPNVVDIQLFRVGQFYTIVAPGEATTMSGRRWRNAVASAASPKDDNNDAPRPIVVLGGPANTYAHYIATPEEYSIQRYEGASTLFGPNTLPAYIHLTLTEHLPRLSDSAPKTDARRVRGPSPPINTNDSLSFITPVVVDNHPLFKSFGDVTTDVHSRYSVGETVRAEFVGANPRNDLRLDRTFAAVEKLSNAGQWERVRDDGDWSLLFEWVRTSTVAGTSRVTISWEMEWEVQDAEGYGDGDGEGRTELLLSRAAEGAGRGRYRIKYYGDAKSIGGSVSAFEGTSMEFEVF